MELLVLLDVRGHELQRQDGQQQADGFSSRVRALSPAMQGVLAPGRGHHRGGCLSTGDAVNGGHVGRDLTLRL